tara:strand:- start:2393 stop:3379 length:987 start_codon:yes stop_codon:yes gene_type:complete
MSYFFILISFIIPFLSLLIAKRLFLLDHPNFKIKFQKKPIPYIGGLSAILISGLFFLSNGFDFNVLLISFITTLGIIDDKFELNPFFRLTAEFILSFLLVISIIPNLSLILILFLTFLGATLINAFNFIDIKDGLVTSYGFIILIYLLNLPSDYESFINFIVYFLCSLLSIYWLNAQPAKAYQGDGGSYSIAAVSFTGILYGLSGIGESLNSTLLPPSEFDVAIPYNSNFIILITLLITFFPAFYEILFTVYQRIRKNKSPFKASNDHIAIRLSSLQYSTYKISVIFMFLPFLSIFLLIINLGKINLISIYLLFSFLLVFCYKFLRRL